MNNTSKLKFLLLIAGIMLIMSALSSTTTEPKKHHQGILEDNENHYDEDEFFEITPVDMDVLKMSALDEVDPFKIDDRSGSGKRWTDTDEVSSGSGTEEDPYIIRNLYINGTEDESCIEIIYSEKYFVIKNCYFVETGDGSSEAGVELYNVKHGMIQSNVVYDIGTDGISVRYCEDIKIYGNTIVDGSYSTDGIDVEYSDDIEIVRNGFSDSSNSLNLQGDGIDIDYTDNVVVSQNQFTEVGTASGATYDVTITDGENITIYRNLFINSDWASISVELCNNVYLVKNTIYNSEATGTSIEYSSNTYVVGNLYQDIDSTALDIDGTSEENLTIAYNIIRDNSFHGISVTGIDYVTVNDNQIYGNDNNGIDVGGGVFLEVKNNTVYENGGHGIDIAQKFCNISHNEVYNNAEMGIRVVGTDMTNASVFSNNITDNGGIYQLYISGDKTKCYSNNITKGVQNGAYFQGSEGFVIDNKIIENGDYWSGTGNGVWVDNFDDSFILFNTITLNGLTGLIIEDCDNLEVSLNDISINEYGIQLYSLSPNPTTQLNISLNSLTKNFECGISTSRPNSVYFRHSATDITIQDNILEENYKTAIFVDLLKDSSIFHNYIYNNGEEGILINRTRGTSGVDIYDNIVIDNKYGIYAMDDDLDKNEIGNPYTGTATVYHNIFWSNSIAQGYDDSAQTTDTVWYNPSTLEGNFWSDASGDDDDEDGLIDGGYTLSGPSAGQDSYAIHGYPILNDGKDGTPLHIDQKGIDGYSFKWIERRWWTTITNFYDLWDQFYKPSEKIAGDGTSGSPYLLEDLTINGGDVEAGISVKNTADYFRIDNCKVTNSDGSDLAGLYINNTINGVIINSNFSLNYYGVYITESTLNIHSVVTQENSADGFRIENCTDFIVYSVQTYDNGANGIILKNCTFSHDINSITANGNNQNGMYIIACNSSLIHDNIASENGNHGIFLLNTEDNSITDNIANFNGEDGIHSQGLTHYFDDNVMIDNDLYGLYVDTQSNNTIITKNVMNENKDGLFFSGGRYYNEITSNTIRDNQQTSLFLQYFFNSTIYGNDIRNSGEDGIALWHSEYTEILENRIEASFDHGIFFFKSNYTLIKMNLIFGGTKNGIFLQQSYNNTIYDNDIINNFGTGIRLLDCQNITSQWNVLDGNGDGFDLMNSQYNTMIDNSITDTSGHGFYIHSNSHNNTIYLNTISGTGNGFDISESDDLTITQNSINGGTYGFNIRDSEDIIIHLNSIQDCGIGINLSGVLDTGGSFYVNITQNTIQDSTLHGILIDDHSGINYIIDNDITGSGQYGLYIATLTAVSNNIWHNEFINNLMNARDEGLINNWDNGTMGNYWDDYNGYDIDGNGIGYTPYNITFTFKTTPSQDRYPIWDIPDTFDPIITIHYPQNGDASATDSPYFNVTIDEYVLDSVYYRLNSGTSVFNASLMGKIFFAEWLGKVDQTQWNVLINGSYSLTFYAEDLKGNTGSATIIIGKDVFDPVITVLTPDQNQVVGISAPSFEISVAEGNLDTLWYRLDNGTIITDNHTFFGFSSIILQSLWDLIGNGSMTVRFYANDTAGNLGFSDLLLRKDTSVPTITIVFPAPNTVYNDEVPFLTVTKSGSNLANSWYSLDGGLHNYSFAGQIVTITKAVWIQSPDGAVEVMVYLSNLAGAVGSDSRTLIKQTSSPSISIISPEDDDVFGLEAPAFEIEISGEDEDSVIWYTINDNDTKYFITELTGTIDQDAWDWLEEGEVTITFYINNTWGNTVLAIVVIEKSIPEPPWWEVIWNWIWGIILFILGLLGLGILIKRYHNRSEDRFCDPAIDPQCQL